MDDLNNNGDRLFIWQRSLRRLCVFKRNYHGDETLGKLYMVKIQN